MNSEGTNSAPTGPIREASMHRGTHRAPTKGRSRYLVVLLVIGMFAALALPASGASWEDKVTGGGWASAGDTDFSLTMSASDVGGQWQYTREEQASATALTMHGTIDCLYVADDLSYAVMSGPVTNVSVGTFGDTVTIAVEEGGVGSGDRVRIWAGSTCGSYTGSFPGTYFDGNVNIRSK
jgi:hypothetical protein